VSIIIAFFQLMTLRGSKVRFKSITCSMPTNPKRAKMPKVKRT